MRSCPHFQTAGHGGVICIITNWLVQVMLLCSRRSEVGEGAQIEYRKVLNEADETLAVMITPDSNRQLERNREIDEPRQKVSNFAHDHN